MPYVCHTEKCRRSGYTFWPSNPRQGVFFKPDSKTPNLYDHSEPGCLFTVLFGTLPLVLTYLCFVQEINPSFDVFNIFIVQYDIQYKNLLRFPLTLRFPLKTTHFCVLIHCSADCWLCLKRFAPGICLSQKIGLKTIEKN